MKPLDKIFEETEARVRAGQGAGGDHAVWSGENASGVAGDGYDVLDVGRTRRRPAQTEWNSAQGWWKVITRNMR